MSTQPLRLGILGCGDFLRWNESALRSSTRITVSAVYDPDQERRTAWAGKLGAKAVDSAQAITTGKDIDAVCLFVPPWIRKGVLLESAQAGKAILTTKPLAPSVEECAEMRAGVERAKVACGVIYNRTRSALIETLRTISESGAIGRISLFKQDWIHSYPRWNTWATDPKRNGGPFMDAMIHNLNAARYLIGRPAASATLIQENHAQQLACPDTEGMVLHFAGGGAAHLFITWAADLATYSTAGNDREHIDLLYMVTDQGWRLTVEGKEVMASRQGEQKRWTITAPSESIYDAFASAVAGGAWPRDLPTLTEAAGDIALIRAGLAAPNQWLDVAPAAARAGG